jgi:putative transposase
MEKHRRNTAAAPPASLDETWFDPVEAAIRGQIRGFIEALVDEELDQALGRPRYQRPKQAERTEPTPRVGYRHGRRRRQLLGSFGPVIINVPRARLRARRPGAACLMTWSRAD